MDAAAHGGRGLPTSIIYQDGLSQMWPQVSLPQVILQLRFPLDYDKLTLKTNQDICYWLFIS